MIIKKYKENIFGFQYYMKITTPEIFINGMKKLCEKYNKKINFEFYYNFIRCAFDEDYQNYFEFNHNYYNSLTRKKECSLHWIENIGKISNLTAITMNIKDMSIIYFDDSGKVMIK